MTFPPLRCLLPCALIACKGASTATAPRPEPEVCQLVPAIEGALAWSGYVVDCGELVRGAPSSEWQRVRDCALAAQQARIAYKLRYDVTSYDSLDSAGVAARGLAQPVLLFRRSSMPSEPWRMLTSLRRVTCADLRARAGCVVTTGELCLECVGEQDGGMLCEEISSLPRKPRS